MTRTQLIRLLQKSLQDLQIKKASPRGTPLATRFWRKVRISGDCWIWSGSRTKTGYGLFDTPTRLAHRISYELTTGPIPDGLAILHKCDNPSCVRPDHLWAGTLSENQKDSKRKGRHYEAAMTHCHRGHPFDEQNTIVSFRKNGGIHRHCKQCRRVRYAAQKRQSIQFNTSR